MIAKQEILLRYFRGGDSQRKISRDLGLNRKTVKRYISDYEKKQLLLTTSSSPELIEDIVSPPTYDSSTRLKRSLSPAIEAEIMLLLTQNKERRNSGQHKQQYKNIDIHEQLKKKGYTVGYSSLCRWIKELEKRSKEAFIRQDYTPGDICEFDWGEVKINTSKGIEVYQMAVFTTGYSNYRYARLFKHQDTSSFQQAHVRFFEKVNGVYKTLVYDNMKVAVKKFVGPKEKEATDGLLKLSMYYNFSFRFCNVRRGNEKGKVERSVEYVRRKAFAFKDEFTSLEEANEYLESICDSLNNLPRKVIKNRSYSDLFNDESSSLFPIKPSFECSEISSVRVDKYSTIAYRTARYSVPDHLVGKMVTLRAYPDKIILSYDDKTLCTHTRLSGLSEWSIKLSHYTKTLKRKPGALAGSVALKQADRALQRVFERYFRSQPKEFIELIEYCGKEAVSVEKLESIISYIKPLKEGDLTLGKIQVLLDKKESPAKPETVESEMGKRCTEQLNELAQLLPESSNNLMQKVEVL